MKKFRLLAAISLFLMATSMILSECGMEFSSLVCLVSSLVPIGVYCYLLDRHERKAK